MYINNYPAKSRGISPDTKPTSPQAELAKIRGCSARLSRITFFFVIQHIVNKAQFSCRKAGRNLYFAIFLPDTRNYVYRGISTNDEYSGHHDHIWAVLQCVE